MTDKEALQQIKEIVGVSSNDEAVAVVAALANPSITVLPVVVWNGRIVVQTPPTGSGVLEAPAAALESAERLLEDASRAYREVQRLQFKSMQEARA